MTHILLIWTIGPLLLLILAYMISRTVFHVLLRIMSLLFLLTLIIGGLSVYSVWQFSTALKSKPQCYVLVDDGHVYAGFLNPPLSVAFSPDMIRFYTTTNNVCQEAGVWVNLTPEFIENTTVTLEQSGIRLSTGDMLHILLADDARSELARVIAHQQNMSQEQIETLLRTQYPDELLLKDMLFASLLGRLLSQDPLLLVQGIREGSIRISPSFFFTRVLPFIPTEVFSLSDTLTARVMERINESGVYGG